MCVQSYRKKLNDLPSGSDSSNNILEPVIYDEALVQSSYY